MSEEAVVVRQLLERVAKEDSTAIGELFHLHRDRLRRMIHLRLDHRLQGRIDPSDVLQEAFLEYARALPIYVQKPDAPFFLWLRLIAGRKLQGLHRQHLGTRMRDPRRELSPYAGPLPEAGSFSLAAQLLGKVTSPSQAFLRAEMQLQIQTALDEMESQDREVLALRHYEQLSNREIAFLLGITEATASIRFIRALKRLRDLLRHVPGLMDDGPKN